MDSLFDSFRNTRVMPLATVDDVNLAVPLARALAKGGAEFFEITLRTASALDVIRAIASEVPSLILGAGTIRSTGAVADCLAAGARFGLSPGFSLEVTEEAQKLGLPFVPGVATPSEVDAAASVGLRLLKLFPANLLGGTRVLPALSGPFPEVSFIATGGISEDNLIEYLNEPNCAGCAGSWITPAGAIARGDFEEIERRMARALEIARKAS